MGNSWEGLAVETLLNAAPLNTTSGFYRTSNGAEIDVVLDMPGQGVWAMEVKRGAAGKPRRGFYNACEDLPGASPGASALMIREAPRGSLCPRAVSSTTNIRCACAASIAPCASASGTVLAHS